MKFSNTVRVGTSRYLTKITTLRRKADREQLRVFTAKHTASLQLLCTVGGGQARLDARSEFKISQRSPKGGEAGRANECKVSTCTILPNFIDLSAEIAGVGKRGKKEEAYVRQVLSCFNSTPLANQDNSPGQPE